MTALGLIVALRNAPKGLTLEEIAEHLNCAPSTARRYLRAARDALPAIWTIEAMPETWHGLRIYRYWLVRDWGVSGPGQLDIANM